ncbi:MAG: outer membrane protein assembly factor BamE [Rhodocyclales bacterium]|jgi:outer membrane protein assembly factor BamE|nr:outer membrane protein assembly factor BamE [Rhodocyclales bacterium]CAG0983515.1 Outer membrane protein assembly factor BamE [Rhodocyclaceae bacterium]
MRFLRYLPVLLPLTACSNVQVPDVATAITPYRIDIRQGNYITQEMVAQLKPGMTRDQVRFILGTPLVADIFHAERWDYIYRFKPGRGEVQQRRFTVFFADHKLVRVAGDVVGAEPGDAGVEAQAAAGARSRVIEIAPDAPPKKPESGEKPEAAAQGAQKQ